jgi:hypothetical protein
MICPQFWTLAIPWVPELVVWTMVLPFRSASASCEGELPNQILPDFCFLTLSPSGYNQMLSAFN